MPLEWRDVWVARKLGPESRERFERACREYHGAEAAFAVSSGRAALWLALEAAKQLQPRRRRVLLPAFTCPTVGRSVMAAELEGLCVDVSPADFNIDADEVEERLSDDVLAIIAPHMFGTPCDLSRLTELCRRVGAFLIEDAAQACGARFGGQKAGTVGELSVLSLGRSKNLRATGGGMLVVNRAELADVVGQQVGRLPEANRPGVRRLGRQIAVSALSGPHGWNIARRVPWLHIGAEDQSFDEAPSRLSGWQAELGLLALRRVDEHNELRARIGRAVEAELAHMAGVHLQAKLPPRESAYVRLAVRLDVAQSERDAIESVLQARGIDARAFYTRPIHHYGWWTAAPEQAPCPNAESLLASNLVLPLYYQMDEPDARRLAQALGEAFTQCRGQSN
jgi:dTDP-4-amino-4,6-dideoxygalactose transaminase